MQVGVVLPVYNQKPQYIHECIESIEFQTFRNFKLVIVVDGANDETVSALNNAVSRLTVDYRILHRKENKGIAYSLNEGFAQLLDCPYLTWISSDNRQHPNFLQLLVAAMKSAPDNVVLVYSMFRLIDNNGKYMPSKYFRVNAEAFMNRPKKHIVQHNFIGPSFLFKKEAYLAAGPYNPDYELVEDYEFWIRLTRVGEIKFLTNRLMEYRFGGEYAYSTTVSRETVFLKCARASVDHRVKSGDIPKVSIIISAHNQEPYVLNAVESVLRQTYDDYHLIIVDDASADMTWTRVCNIYSEKIIQVQLAENRGKAGAMNVGLQFALGEYVLDLDADDWLAPETLEVLVREMDRLPADTGLAYANRKLWYESKQGLKEGEVVKGIRYKDKYEVIEKMKTHCPRFYRREALLSIGGWEAEINGQKVMAEDFSNMVRLAEKYRFHWVDSTLYHQRRHKNNMSVTSADIFMAQLMFMVKRALKDWGGNCEPKFNIAGGWISGVEIIPTGNQLPKRGDWF